MKLIKDIVNDLLNRRIKLHGNFDNWNEAKKKSKGYNDNIIFIKTKKSLNKVLHGNAKYERDSVAFYKDNPNSELIKIISEIKKSKINICDFGGSFASLYFQNIKFIKKGEITWNVVEQKKYVDYARRKIKIKNLKFYKNINSVLNKKIDLIIFSSVLQYIEFPFEVLQKVIKKKVNKVLVLRTPFSNKNNHIKIQIVPKNIYNSNYPVRIFNYNFFLKFMTNNGYKIKKKLFTNEKLGSYSYKALYFIIIELLL